MPTVYRAYAAGGCFGPGGEILPASQCAGTTTPPRHSGGSTTSKHSSTPPGCIAAGGEILPGSQCQKLGIKPGTQSTTITAQGRRIPVTRGSGSRPPPTGGVVGPGGEIYATPAYATYYQQKYHRPYPGAVGHYDNMGNFLVYKPDGSTGYYDSMGYWHDTTGSRPMAPSLVGTGLSTLDPLKAAFSKTHVGTQLTDGQALDALGKGGGVGGSISNLWKDFLGHKPAPQVWADIITTGCAIHAASYAAFGKSGECDSGRIKRPARPPVDQQQALREAQKRGVIEDSFDAMFNTVKPAFDYIGNGAGEGFRAAVYGLG